MEMTFFQVLWFFLIFLLIAGYFVLDGFDLGAGVLYPFVAKSERDKAVVRRSIGKRLIELRRAESDDAQGTQAVDPIDPADVSGSENAPCFGV